VGRFVSGKFVVAAAKILNEGVSGIQRLNPAPPTTTLSTVSQRNTALSGEACEWDWRVQKPRSGS
jgi:hypothetical protein